MNLKEKLYQLFIIGLDGLSVNENPNLIGALNKNLGGVIFFTKNINSESQITNLCAEIKAISKTHPFLAIDQEGGRVERTENLFGGKKYLSARFAAQKGENFLIKQTENIAIELKKYGFNLNFAPCLDVNTNCNNPIIGERAFSDKTAEVIKYGQIVINTYLKNGIIPCTKHFPGHGDASTDSHLSLPKIDLSFSELEKFHIKPFFEVKSPMIMVAHLHCLAFDKEIIPSSISKNVLSYLTKNYNGLIISDDMVMGGITSINPVDACCQAIKNGVNILLYRASDNQTIEIIEQIYQKSTKDKLLTQKIEDSFEKIINFKSSKIHS